MARISQHNSKRSTQSKNRSKTAHFKTAEEIEFFSTLDEGRANLIADKLIAYVETNEHVRSFSSFLREQGLLSSRFFEAAKKFPKLATATEYASEIFAERKEKIAEEKDNKFHTDTMHLYSFLFAQDKALEHERKKELKKITEESKNTSNQEAIQAVIKNLLAPLE